jgi:hypothetical protein
MIGLVTMDVINKLRNDFEMMILSKLGLLKLVQVSVLPGLVHCHTINGFRMRRDIKDLLNWLRSD